MEFIRPTDKKHIVQCESGIHHVSWGSICASTGDSIKLDIGTSFMGLGSEVNLTFKDERGRTALELTKPVYADRVSTTIDIPEKIKKHLICEATLSSNGKSLQSTPLVIVSPRSVHELTWSDNSVGRGDIVALNAHTLGFVSGTPALIHIYEYDNFGAHQPVAELLTTIDKDEIEVMWQFQCRGNTNDILTEAEWAPQREQYQAPSYFWAAEVDGLHYGVSQNSGLLVFDKDELEIRLYGYTGLAHSDYSIVLADGKEVTGTLPADGLVKVKGVTPGPIRLKMASLATITAQPIPEIMPKGSIPLPDKIPNYQMQSANSSNFNKGWGWKRYPLLKNATWIGLASTLLTSGSMRIERWEESGYEYVYYVDENVITIIHEQKTIIKLFIQDNELINIVGETTDRKPVFGATVGVIDAHGRVGTIVAAMDENSELKWRIYKANGGEESFEVWTNTGEPLDVEVEYPVRNSRIKDSETNVRKIYLETSSSKDMVAQTNSYSCGPACGVQFLKDLGISVDEITLIFESGANSIIGGTTADDLSIALNRVQDQYTFNGGVVGAENFDKLLKRGPFIANIKINAKSPGHFVIVDSADEGGIVKLRDPDPTGLQLPQSNGIDATIEKIEFIRVFERTDGSVVFIEKKAK